MGWSENENWVRIRTEFASLRQERPRVRFGLTVPALYPVLAGVAVPPDLALRRGRLSYPNRGTIT
jgi:hypothetical protein